ncbi:MAG: glycosyltransferase [Chloroflexota bacterium]|nr:glycosyltransferase [Chloroflexota bacterium]
MDLSIVTPSYNMLGYLKRACASVRDQEGASFEHIVVDAMSTDGTVDWLRTAPAVTSIVEKDNGMYDAINKGLRRARGEIVSYLNCDEQYLPGSLQYVKEYFDTHPDVDGICGDVLLIRPDGSLIAFIKSYPPIWPFILANHLYVYPCSMFLRRRIIDHGDLFDATFKDIGDEEFVVRLLRKRYRLKNVRRYLSAFTMTQANRSQQPFALQEGLRMREYVPAWVDRYRRPLNIARLFLKLVSGAYFERPPLSYALYTTDPDRGRALFSARRLSPRFRLA